MNIVLFLSPRSPITNACKSMHKPANDVFVFYATVYIPFIPLVGLLWKSSIISRQNVNVCDTCRICCCHMRPENFCFIYLLCNTSVSGRDIELPAIRALYIFRYVRQCDKIRLLPRFRQIELSVFTNKVGVFFCPFVIRKNNVVLDVFDHNIFTLENSF